MHGPLKKGRHSGRYITAILSASEICRQISSSFIFRFTMKDNDARPASSASGLHVTPSAVSAFSSDAMCSYRVGTISELKLIRITLSKCVKQTKFAKSQKIK